VQSFSDPAIDTCPECEGAVRKIYSNVGVVFKGSGFYKTDSKVKSEPKAKSQSKVEKAPTPKSDS
jgi:predicted nucleic acid-binding Zn ribbon protein